MNLAGASFPLTALSPGETGNRFPVFRQFAASLCAESRSACLRGPDPVAVRRHSLNTNAPFPLTPALSLGERVTADPAFELAERHCSSSDWQTILPLPWGEGR